jgi:hypothetical protein
MPVDVFVSSTFNDLRNHRERAIQQLRDAGYHVNGMENWPPDDRQPWKFCPEEVRKCQLVVSLVGYRRGWVPDGKNRSITQLEYDEAVRYGIDVLPFLVSDSASDWPAEFDERKSDPGMEPWRNAIRSQAGNERFHFRTDVKTLDILPAVTRWQQRQQERTRLADYLKSVRDAHLGINFLGLPTFEENPDVGIDQLFVEPALGTRFAEADLDPNVWDGVAPLSDTVADRRGLSSWATRGRGNPPW